MLREISKNKIYINEQGPEVAEKKFNYLVRN